MNKRAHEYEVTFNYLKDNKGEVVDKEPIRFPFNNHDNIYKILDVLTEKKLFEDDNQTVQFAIGLKLLGDVVMKNKDKELFSELQPAFVEFMKKLKSKE
ncbi:DUF3861 domain-containing protein [Sphingobacterium arenae]|uniref:DUF3861 domain-containing protein n=1 Tax=Sphingobacterium arenae TaxID=1280598 RepID=A0ABR7Y5X3_9SPHI|nr:DUF3861 domain-containing protein [Sphingobacterium arenae]MBD1426708.1 DUF3861 domain-containing protein [Sphingobacterium arenae]